MFRLINIIIVISVNTTADGKLFVFVVYVCVCLRACVYVCMCVCVCVLHHQYSVLKSAFCVDNMTSLPFQSSERFVFVVCFSSFCQQIQHTNVIH